jgi:tRNA nucleotidyltransferase (CCA-adding enzyme)
MVPAASDLPDSVLERLAALPAGAQLLGALDGLEGVHLVGGAVRDLLLGRAPHELDLVAEADGPRVARTLADRLGGSTRVHEPFGTASVEGDGIRLDIATARAERYPRPGALPEVRSAGLDEDMARRDFTANAIAVGLSPDRRGTLHAAPRALEDLAARRLRVLHDASFVDDPTRLGRLARYASRLGFEIEPHTAALARAAFASGAPETAGPARTGNELRLLLGDERPVAGLVLLDELGGADRLDVDPPLLERVLALVPAGGSRELALLAALTRRHPREVVAPWLAGMHVQGADRVLDAIDGPGALAAALGAAARPSEVARLLRHRSVEAAVLAGALGAEEPVRRWLDDLRDVRLSITGADLLAAGVPQGPEVGRRLAAALDRKLDGEIATREEELAAALAA